MWGQERPPLPPTNTEVLHDTIIKEGRVGLASLDYVRSPTRKRVLLSALTSFLQPIQEHYIISLSIYICIWDKPLIWKMCPATGEHLRRSQAALADVHVRPLLGSITKRVFLVPLHLSKVEFCARHPVVDVLDVVAGALEVSGGVVRTGDEDLESSPERDKVSVHMGRQAAITGQ